MTSQNSRTYTRTLVWSRNIRLFHWINVIAITLLIIIGLIIFNGKTLGITVEGKVLLKTLHVLTGYVFSINLLIRILLGFFGKGFEKWGKTLPFNKGYIKELTEFKQKKKKVYLGHNPFGKLMIAAMLTCMSIQMISGLVLAGTDIYYPPLGQYFAERVADDKQRISEITPYSKDNINEQAYKAMRVDRKPFIIAHTYSFYILIFLIPLHISGVFFAERKEKTALVSAMISGYKYLKNNDEHE